MNLKNIFRNIAQSATLALTASASLLLAGCMGDRFADDPYEGFEGIRFRADVSDSPQLSTRADESYYVSTQFYDCDFYFRVEEYPPSPDEHTADFDAAKSSSSVYVIPSGYEGAVIPKFFKVDPGDESIPQDQWPVHTEKTLNWFSRDIEHGFWGWTLPTVQDYRPETATHDGYITIPFEDTDLSATTSSTADTWKEGVWGNGRELEKMIGAYAGPYIYNEAGIYIPIHFRHLVSKIFLKNLTVVNNFSGGSVSNLKGVITLYGVPREAHFYPCPYDKETGEPTYPYVDKPEGWDYDDKSRVSYAITNVSKDYKWEGHSLSEKDCWYICPELDLSQLEFRIDIYEYKNGGWELSRSHGKQGAYYGDFRNIEIKRTGNNNYDSGEGGDETVLHAGEYLELSISLYEKGNPAVNGTITSWTTVSKRTGSSHVEQGLYSIEQMKDFSSVMGKGDEQAINDYFELNGSGRDTGADPEGEYPDYEEIYGKELKVFELFDDIGADSSGTATTTKMGNPLNVADGYILDGQGHTINVTAYNPFKVGMVRDVYLRYYSGNVEYIVYIDKMGNIWKVDPKTYKETPTGYNVNTGYTPININLSTGLVTKPN